MYERTQVVIKVFTEDGASKAVVVDESMTAAMVCHLLAIKNHWEESPHWQLVERLGDLSVERVLEDHENVVDVHNSWPRDNKNVFVFKKNKKKYDLMEQPLVSLMMAHGVEHLRMSTCLNVCTGMAQGLKSTYCAC